MGVKGLTKFLKENDLVKAISLTDLKTEYNVKSIGIDFSLYLHKICYKLNNPDVSKKDNIDNIIKYFKTQINRTLKDFEVHYIFDSKSHELKKELIEKRKTSNKINICSEYYLETIEFFKKNDIKYHLSPDGIEAEQYAAKLIHDNIIQAVLTDDIDTIVFGANILIKNVKNKMCDIIMLDSILEKLEISMDDLINISIMSGTDFNTRGVYNYGINKSYKFIKNNKSQDINTILYSIKNYQHIYNLFTHYKIDVN